MLNGLIFDNRRNTAENWGNIFKYLISTDGIIMGCELSFRENLITISEGYFILQGRIVQIQTEEKIEIDPKLTNGYLRLRYRIDLEKVACADAFLQGYFEEDYSDKIAFDELLQENINKTGTLFDIEFAVLEISNGKLQTLIRQLKKSEISADKIKGKSENELEVAHSVYSERATEAKLSEDTNKLGGKQESELIVKQAGGLPVSTTSRFSFPSTVGGLVYLAIKFGNLTVLYISVRFNTELNGIPDGGTIAQIVEPEFRPHNPITVPASVHRHDLKPIIATATINPNGAITYKSWNPGGANCRFVTVQAMYRTDY